MPKNKIEIFLSIVTLILPFTLLAQATPPVEVLSASDPFPAAPAQVVAVPTPPATPRIPGAGTSAIGSARFGFVGLYSQDLQAPAADAVMGGGISFNAHSQRFQTNLGTQPANASVFLTLQRDGSFAGGGHVDFGIQRNDNGLAPALNADLDVGSNIVGLRYQMGASYGYGNGTGSVSFMVRMPLFGGGEAIRDRINNSLNILLNLVGGRIVAIHNFGDYFNVEISGDASWLMDAQSSRSDGTFASYLAAAVNLDLHNRAQTGHLRLGADIQDLHSVRDTAGVITESQTTPARIGFTAQGAF